MRQPMLAIDPKHELKFTHDRTSSMSRAQALRGLIPPGMYRPRHAVTVFCELARATQAYIVEPDDLIMVLERKVYDATTEVRHVLVSASDGRSAFGWLVDVERLSNVLERIV